MEGKAIEPDSTGWHNNGCDSATESITVASLRVETMVFSGIPLVDYYYYYNYGILLAGH